MVLRTASGACEKRIIIITINIELYAATAVDGDAV